MSRTEQDFDLEYSPWTPLIETMHSKPVELAVVPPTLFEKPSSNEPLLKSLKPSFKFCYSGGPLAQHAGATIFQHSKVISIFGATEMGHLPLLEIDE